MVNLFFWRQKSATATVGRKTRKPPNTAFRQQRLKAWQPVLTPKSVLPLLILMACFFAPVGVGLLVSIASVQDLSINYSDCRNLASYNEYTDIPKKLRKYHFKKKIDTQPQWMLVESNNLTEAEAICRLKFDIPNNLKNKVLVYYKMTNFYQNHRKFVESMDYDQLKGKPLHWKDLNTNCKPLRSEGNKSIYPCGLAANAFFNDTFQHQLTRIDDVDGENYTLTNQGISWSTDRHRFRPTRYNASDIVPPPNWYKKFPNGYTQENLPDLSTWEEFHVWMRSAALPHFYKLALKNQSHELPKGTYTTDIGLNYNVTIFGGTKSYVLTTNSIIGARNYALSIVFIVVAGVSGIFAFIFLVQVIVKPHSMSDHTYLNFESNENQPQYNFNNVYEGNTKYDNTPFREML